MAESECDWNIDMLKVHLETQIHAVFTQMAALFEAQEKLNQQRFAALRDTTAAAQAASNVAINKAETATEKRLESVNEFRNTLSDQQRNLIPRAEFEALEKSLTFRLEALDKQLAATRSEGLGIKGGWAAAAGVVGFVVVVLTLLSIAANFLNKG